MTTHDLYFSVQHHFNLYLLPWDSQQTIPDENQLKTLQSAGLSLVNEVKQLENNCLMQLRQLEIDAKAIVDYLKLQSKKIDLVLQFMLEQENHQGSQYQGIEFGGSGFKFISDTPFEIGALFTTSVFLRDEIISLRCITEVSGSSIQDNLYHTQLSFVAIQDTDIEQLVQASLRVQQKMLKQRQGNTRSN